MIYKFTNHSMYEIYELLKKELAKIDEVSFEVLNPDLYRHKYSGFKVLLEDIEYIHRSYRSWLALANRLSCRVLTPLKIGDNLVRFTFEKLDVDDSFHTIKAHKEEKYGESSIFFDINKNEEPEIMISYLEALKNVNISKRLKILNLGINSGEEFELIKKISTNFSSQELVGIDYCQSAIKYAKKRFKDKENIELYCHDINDLESLDLGRFDLIISIGTLQSTNLEFNKTFMSIIQNYLKKDGAMILGFPNCRWHDGDILYGAVAKNYNFSEMSLLFKDAIFCKKYLQQKKFRVTLTGKNYIFLTATSIRKD